MNDRMTLFAFAARVRSSWDEWYGLVACVTNERAAERGYHKDWTLTDVIAHVTWYERQMIGILETRRFAGSDLWELATDERNEIIRQETTGRSHSEVLKDARLTHDRMVELLDGLTDDELYDPAAFPGMPAEWTPAQIFEGNTFEHYEGHAELVREYFANRR